jgi:GNAT superfamily N-acetyltransferase
MNVRVRRAQPADAGEVADIGLAARAAALPTVRWAHSPEQVRAWIAGTLLPRGGVWVAVDEELILGFIALHGDWVEQLYLRPGHWRRGIGTTLLGHAKSLSPSGLRLWCFQCNLPARAFYEAQGFTAIKWTDGAGNEEREPDILYAWPHANAFDAFS